MGRFCERKSSKSRPMAGDSNSGLGDVNERLLQQCTPGYDAKLAMKLTVDFG